MVTRLSDAGGAPVREVRQPHGVAPGGAHAPLLEGLEEGCGVQEVGGVKALGEPAVDRGQEVMRLGALPLLLPEPRQARGNAFFVRLLPDLQILVPRQAALRACHALAAQYSLPRRPPAYSHSASTSLAASRNAPLPYG